MDDIAIGWQERLKKTPLSEDDVYKYAKILANHGKAYDEEFRRSLNHQLLQLWGV